MVMGRWARSEVGIEVDVAVEVTVSAIVSVAVAVAVVVAVGVVSGVSWCRSDKGSVASSPALPWADSDVCHRKANTPKVAISTGMSIGFFFIYLRPFPYSY
jgi:hypothetical protein